LNRIQTLFTCILFISLVVCLALSGCTPSNTGKLNVVTSTSLLAFIVENIGGNLVDVVNIIPPAQCPGHFDVKPGDIQKLSEADIFFMHGWQGEKFSTDLIASAQNPNLTVAVVDIQGNWMTPPVQIEATDKITSELCQIDSTNSSAYQESADKYKKTVTATGEELKSILNEANTSNINVLCAEQQMGFVKWTGLNVIGTFGRPDSLTPQVIKELVDTGKAENVTLIIDNLQSGKDAGASIAEELGCNRIILSNFPGGFDDTETWEKAINKNVELILETIISQGNS
jgi:zinc transport system substrate-binding protein